MGLESLTPTTFISGLTQSWPTAGEPKSQGDDHIRLIKGVLQNTFPGASSAFRFPKVSPAAAPITLDVTAQNTIVTVWTGSGDVNVTLPVATTLDPGWSCEVMKISPDANAAVVRGQSINISSQVGISTLIRVGAVYQPVRFLWTGTQWVAVKPGLPIGATISFDGPSLPAGFLIHDGSAYDPAKFEELALATQISFVRDKRGKVEAGVDGGAGYLTTAWFGSPAVLGAVGGNESHQLTSPQSGSPAHNHSVFLNDPGHTHTLLNTNAGGVYSSNGNNAGSPLFDQSASAARSTNASPTGLTVWSGPGGTGTQNKVDFGTAANAAERHHNVQPTIIVQKLIRAC